MASIESLLGEVKPSLESAFALRAAEQLFFGDNIVYGHHSNEGPSFSKAADAQQQKPQGKKEKKEKGGKDHAHKGKHDELDAAISSTKEIVHSALHHGGHAAGDSRVDFAADVKQLKEDVENLKLENSKLRTVVDELSETVRKILAKVNLSEPPKAAASAPAKVEEKKEGGDDFDLFGSSDEEEDEEKERIKQERLKAYAEKKAKKPAEAAKSSVILDVKPWDDETDMVEMEKKVRAMERDGLVWGGSKLIPLAYGLKKLQIICIVEDEKVSVDELSENIVDEISELVQSVDVVAFNKV